MILKSKHYLHAYTFILITSVLYLIHAHIYAILSLSHLNTHPHNYSQIYIIWGRKDNLSESNISKTINDTKKTSIYSL